MDCTVIEFNVSVTELNGGDSLEARLKVIPEPKETGDPSPNPAWDWPSDSDIIFGIPVQSPNKAASFKRSLDVLERKTIRN